MSSAAGQRRCGCRSVRGESRAWSRGFSYAGAQRRKIPRAAEAFSTPGHSGGHSHGLQRHIPRSAEAIPTPSGKKRQIPQEGFIDSQVRRGVSFFGAWVSPLESSRSTLEVIPTVSRDISHGQRRRFPRRGTPEVIPTASRDISHGQRRSFPRRGTAEVIPTGRRDKSHGLQGAFPRRGQQRRRFPRRRTAETFPTEYRGNNPRRPSNKVGSSCTADDLYRPW